MTEGKKRFLLLSGIVVLAVFSRLLPHPANFTPLAAIALFGGAYFLDRKWAYAVPLGAMLLSDLALQLLFWSGVRAYPGFYPDMAFVYLSFALVVGMGGWLRHRVRPLPVVGAAVAASMAFYLITNFGYWMTVHMYPMNFAGLMECYIAAIPFFGRTLAGNLLYSVLIFGAFEWVLLQRPQWRAAALSQVAK